MRNHYILVSSIQFESVFYFHRLKKSKKKGLTIEDAVRDEVDGQAKPLVAVLNGYHAVTFTGKDGTDLVFKNSYGTKNSIIKIPENRLPFDRNDLNLILQAINERLYGITIQASSSSTYLSEPN